MLKFCATASGPRYRQMLGSPACIDVLSRGHVQVRVAHQLASRLGRDVTLGATSIDTPASFLAHMRSLSGA